MLLTLIYFILILGVIVLVHEFGHFFFAKLFGIYVYEFSIGMGPKIFGWKSKKGETDYSIRAIPIGGYCALAGEDVESDDQAKIPKDRRLNAKPVWQRFLVMVFGAGNNFLLALLILFIMGLSWGATSNKAIVSDFAHYITVAETNSELGLKQGDKILKVNDEVIDVSEHDKLSYYLAKAGTEKVTLLVDRNNEGKEIELVNTKSLSRQILYNIPLTAAEKAGIQIGDKIVKVNGSKVKTTDDVALYLQMYGKKKTVKFTVVRNGEKKVINVKPDVEEVSKTKVYRVGIISEGEVEHGFIASVKYAFTKVGSLFRQMVITLKGLFTGGLSVKQLSGPVGIYNIVGTQSKAGLQNVLYLIALLSVNVGFINLLPFPAFDGGRVLFLIIEKIKGSPVKPETENKIHTIGFMLLIALMIYITFNDIFKLF